MKGIKYKFKYLLYDLSSNRFSEREARILLGSKYEQDLLFRDLSTRSQTYREKVKKNFRKHESLLYGLLEMMNKLPESKSGVNGSGHRVKGKRVERTQYSFTRVFQGGAPGLGKRS